MSLHPFQTKSKFVMLTVNSVYTDLPAAPFQFPMEPGSCPPCRSPISASGTYTRGALDEAQLYVQFPYPLLR
jgi:hypothetical protein